MEYLNIPFVNIKPASMSDAVWKVLVEAWGDGLSDREAAFRITKVTGEAVTAEQIKKLCKADPEVGELRAMLQSELLSTAKTIIADSLRDGDIKTAKWYAERKGADEFSTKSAVEFEGAVTELSLEDKEKKLKEMMEKFKSGE